MFALKKSSLITLATCSTILAMSSVNTAEAQQAIASNYQWSCRNIEVDGDVLSASCQTRYGQFRQSSITIPGIENRNGKLRFTNLERESTYQWSCRNIEVDGDVLSASCRTRNGQFRQSSIRILGIYNLNGRLSF